MRVQMIPVNEPRLGSRELEYRNGMFADRLDIFRGTFYRSL
jgi:hypothetical protein